MTPTETPELKPKRNGVIRCTVLLGRIFNGQKYLKKDIDNPDGKHDDARVRQAPERRATKRKMKTPSKTVEQARAEGFNAVASRPTYSPNNPYDEDETPEHYAAWEDGATEAGWNSAYHNGVLIK